MKLWQPKFRPARKPLSKAKPVREKNQIVVPAIPEIVQVDNLSKSKPELTLDQKEPPTVPVEEPKKVPPKETVFNMPVEELRTSRPPKTEFSGNEKPTTSRKYRVLKKRQRRRQSLSVAVSEEEEELLREFAASKEKSFSSWARETLFKAMGRKIPKRPT